MPETSNDVHVQDVFPVRSRVSWGAIFAGVIVALAVYLVLGLLGTAVALSAATGDNQPDARGVGSGLAIWSVLVMLISLFLGGWVASMCTVGETKGESAMYGVLVWGLFLFATLWLTTSAVRAGFNLVLGVSGTAAQAVELTPADWERLGAQAGLTREQIEQLRLNTAQLRATTQEFGQNAAAAAWWTWVGVLVSLLAAIGGAMAGAGPTPFLRRIVATGTGRGTVTAPATTTTPRR